ncbi:hypothetical protein VE03_05188 [Pseudogymnoascus sp. 23342-1-I1]|nr:hypothetical protein VE03_05188 [Pseudogymnoascus sp. 23342-1-I1]
MFVKFGRNPEELSKKFLPLYFLQASNLINLGQNKRAVDLLEQVAKIEEATLAKDHPGRLASQHTLAGAYQAIGQVKEAINLLEQVVEIRQATTLAEDHPDRLASQYTLAVTYGDNDQVKEAVDLLEQVVKIREAILAEDHPDRLKSQDTLAYYQQGPTLPPVNGAFVDEFLLAGALEKERYEDLEAGERKRFITLWTASQEIGRINWWRRV